MMESYKSRPLSGRISYAPQGSETEPGTLELLRAYALQNLNYNPETGLLTWANQTIQNQFLIGRTERSINSRGYYLISLQCKSYLVHRIVWLMTYGSWPEFIDHVNRVRTDNRIENLREATRMQNCRNKGAYKKKSGLLPGVSNHSGKYRARIRVNRRLIVIGNFQTQELAHSAYNDARQKHFAEFSPR